MKFEIISEFRSVETIASGREIRVLPLLRKRWGAGRWRKMKGIARARILRTGNIREAEIHWYEAHGVGKRDFNQEAIEMNDKRYLDAVVCIANEGNEASLQLWKIYKTLRDNDAQAEGFLRVIDESGDDYLFPEENFVSISLPVEARKPFERAVREQRRASSRVARPSSIKRPSRSNTARKRRVSRAHLASRSS